MCKSHLVTFFILFLFFNSYSQDSIKQIIPTEVLLKKVKQHNFSISPNGKYFAQVINNNIENDIIIIDIEDYKLHQRIPMGRKSIQNLYWLNSKRLLYESLGEILAIDIDGTNSTIIVDRLAKKLTRNYNKFYKNFRFNSLISFLPKNKNEILIETYDYSTYAMVKRVNIFTGEKNTVISGKQHKINKWITDAEGKVRLGLRFDDYGLHYLKLNSQTKKWMQFEVVIEGEKYPLRIHADSYLAQKITFEGFGYDPNIIYLTSNIDSDRRKFLAYNIKENKVIETLADDINCDITDPHGEDMELIFNHTAKKLAGVKYESITPTYKWLSTELSKYHSIINKNHPNFMNEIIDFDDKIERLLVHQWNDQSKGNIGVFDTKDSSYAVMFHFNKELDKYKLSKSKIITASSRDDYKLPCYLNLPISYSKEKQIPLVVIPHGGPWARDYWGMDDFSQYFATRGYASLRVNFRGSTGFGKSHVLAGVNSIDGVMIDDIADAVSYVANHYAIDKQQIFIFGHSYGGYATYMSLLKYPNLYTSGVAISAPTDIKEWMKQQKKDKNHFSYEFWNAALGSKQSKYLSKISPINYTEKFKNPLLIFHGKYDEIVPLEHAEKMIQKLNKNKKNAKLEILQRGGHSILDSNSLGYILDSANEFFVNSVKKD